MEHVICYVSTATEELKTEELQEFLKQWEDRNNKNDIKGILLFSDGHFFQVLEGEKVQVLELYERVKNDPRHRDIIQVLGKDVEKGSMDHYITDYLQEQLYSKPDLLSEYLEAVKGMETPVQQQIRVILGNFIDIQVL